MMLNRLDHPLSRKIEVVTNYLIKLQSCYEQSSISFFINHGPQVLTTSVLMVLYESLGHVCNLRYAKATIYVFSVVLYYLKTVNSGYFANGAKEVGSRDPTSNI